MVRRGRKKKCNSGYNKNNKLKVFTAFSGYDSQCMALDTLKEDSDFDYDLVGWSEIDKNAIIAHNALFPQWKDRNYGDISKINWEEVPDFDLFTYSSPCFVAGTTIIMDDNTCKNIEDIQIGDMVLTHDGTYKKVTEVMKNPYKGILYTLESCNGDLVTCTPEHPFYCREICEDKFQWISAQKIDINYGVLMACLDKHKKYYLKPIGFNKKYITPIIKEIFVYNLEVEDNHSYCANNFVVHNCTDFSQAGYQKGGDEGSGTRSSLLWECRKAILTKRPKYLLFENVKALISDKFIHVFNKWCKELENYGYNNFWQVLNAKDYGIPQSRERIFMVSIRKDENDQNPYYEFPEKIKLEKSLDDIYEDNVSDKYYFPQNKVDNYVKHLQEDYPHDEGLDTEDNESLF